MDALHFSLLASTGSTVLLKHPLPWLDSPFIPTPLPRGQHSLSQPASQMWAPSVLWAPHIVSRFLPLFNTFLASSSQEVPHLSIKAFPCPCALDFPSPLLSYLLITFVSSLSLTLHPSSPLSVLPHQLVSTVLPPPRVKGALYLPRAGASLSWKGLVIPFPSPHEQPLPVHICSCRVIRAH